MIFLRSNTAVIVAVGPFFDKTDGVTIETALTITNERITLIAETDAGSAPTLILDNIAGATGSTSNDLNYITNGDNGMMQMELQASDVNRVGRMKLSITDAANHVPVFHEFFVLPQAIFDWLTGVIVPLPANMTQILGTAVSTPTVAGVPNVNVKTWNDLATVALPLIPTTAGRTLDVSAGGEAGVDWANVGSPTTVLNLSGTTIKTATDIATAVNIIDDFLDTEIAQIIGYLDTEIADILADTNELQTDWTNGGRLDLLIDAIKAVTDLLTAAQAEPTGVPAANATPLGKLGFIFAALRNKITVTSTKKQYFDDADAALWEKDLSDDGTTYIESEANAP